MPQKNGIQRHRFLNQFYASYNDDHDDKRKNDTSFDFPSAANQLKRIFARFEIIILNAAVYGDGAIFIFYTINQLTNRCHTHKAHIFSLDLQHMLKAKISEEEKNLT